MTAPRVQTLGCRLNAYESEVISMLGAEAGLDDAVIVITCAVTSEAVRQARQAIRKARRGLHKRGRGADLDDVELRASFLYLVRAGELVERLREDTAEVVAAEEVLARGRLAVVPRASHSVMLDNPEGFRGAVGAFVLGDA